MIQRAASRTLPPILQAALIATLIAGLATGGTIAAQSEQRAPRSDAAMTVVPDPVTAYGAEYVVNGSGFKADTAVSIVISMPTCCAFFTVTADAEGAFWFRYTTGDPGMYQIDANQRLNNRKLTLMATATFEVVSP